MRRFASLFHRHGLPAERSRRLLSGVAWSVAAAVVTQGTGFAVSVLLARLLGKAVFGQYGIIQNTVVTFSNIAALGLGVTATRYLARFRDTDPTRAARIAGLCAATATLTGGFFCATLLLCAPLLAQRFFLAPELAPALRAAAAFVFFNTLTAYQVGAFAGLEDFRGLARVSAAQAALWLVLAAVLTHLWSLFGATLSLGLAAFSQFVLSRVMLLREMHRRKISFTYRGALREWRILVSFSLPAAASSLIGALAIWFANTNLVRQTNGFSHMAIVGVGNTLRTLILFAPTLVNRAVAPFLTSMDAEGVDYRPLFRLNLRVLGLAAAAIAAVISLGVAPILSLYGPAFASGRAVVIVFVWSGVLEVLAVASYQKLFVHGRMWWQLAINVLWGAVLLAIAAPVAHSWGAMGLGIGYLAAWAVAYAAYALCGRRLDAPPDDSAR